MTAARDPDRLIGAFLSEGQTQLPDRAYEHVRHTIDRTRQRVVVGPWREPRMSSFIRAAIAAAAVVVAAVVGFNLGPGPGVGGPTPAPPSVSPSPLVSSSASPSLSGLGIASPPAYAWPRALAAGTYKTSFAWGDDYAFTFTVPDGWESRDINIDKGNRMSVQFFIVQNVYVDPCGEAVRKPPIGRLVPDVVNGLATLVTFETGPVPAQLLGRSGTYVEFTTGPDYACGPSQFHLFKLPALQCGVGCGALGPAWKGLEFDGALEHNRMWILEVGRHHVVIDAVWSPEATAADLAQLETVIDSIGLALPNATAPPHPESISPSP